jgi:hypothetical protein
MIYHTHIFNKTCVVRAFRTLLPVVLGIGSLFVNAHAGDKPNFVFILVDDLGRQDLGCYGSTFHQTPHIDQLSQEGVRFTDAYSASSICSPTRASILTGNIQCVSGSHAPRLSKA